MDIRKPDQLTQAPAAPKSAAPSPVTPQAPLDPVDQIHFTKQDLNKNGKLQIIVTAQGKDLAAAKKSFAASHKGATVTEDLPIINGFVAQVDPKRLPPIFKAKQEGYNITVDGRVQMPQPIAPKTGVDQPVQPKMDTVIPSMGVDKLWAQGYTGKGVTIAVLDTGIYPHPDLKDRIIGFKDFINGEHQPYDDQGHGTHVSGDSAGDGTASAGKFKGTAPGANLVGVKILDKNGAGRFSDIIKGLQWTVDNKDKYNIRVINMSLGGPAFQSYKDDPISQAAEAAVRAGIIPVVAAGNSGPKPGTVGSPGMDPQVLTVGALNDHGTIDRSDDDVAFFSSRGPTTPDGLTKPDILSPGVAITAANAPGSALDQMPKIPHVGSWYITISGTSMATPVMAGIVADIISANPKLTPQQIKHIFMSTAGKISGQGDANQQGAGAVMPEQALQKALALKTS